MYLERIEKRFKIIEEIGNPLTEGQIGSPWIKGISNILTVGKRNILNLSVELNQRIEQGIELTIGILDF